MYDIFIFEKATETLIWYTEDLLSYFIEFKVKKKNYAYFDS